MPVLDDEMARVCHFFSAAAQPPLPLDGNFFFFVRSAVCQQTVPKRSNLMLHHRILREWRSSMRMVCQFRAPSPKGERDRLATRSYRRSGVPAEVSDPAPRREIPWLSVEDGREREMCANAEAEPLSPSLPLTASRTGTRAKKESRRRRPGHLVGLPRLAVH